VSRLYGAVPNDAQPSETGVPLRRLWVVLDPTLRVLAVEPFRDDRSDIDAVLRIVEGLPPAGTIAGLEVPPPVLFLPNVFEPAFCARLIQLYETHGGEESGFMREVEGKTVLVADHRHKRRKDHVIADPDLVGETQQRFRRRVVPEIRKVHHFTVTRMERYIVSCYAAEDEGHFQPHRDNTTKGTAHRRFAVSVNLNDAFDGGEISFPEYGPRSYKMPAGGAVVFSCSLLHAVSKVTAGRRYAFLPFLYDEAAAKLREQNNAFVGDGLGDYRAS
jgi:predicted 2-oxoglutarate/Fe(II)-dependent dioxygenase YbiX